MSKYYARFKREVQKTNKLDLRLEGLLTAFQFHTEHAFSKQPELDKVFDTYLPKFQALISTEVAKATDERLAELYHSPWGDAQLEMKRAAERLDRTAEVESNGGAE